MLKVLVHVRGQHQVHNGLAGGDVVAGRQLSKNVEARVARGQLEGQRGVMVFQHSPANNENGQFLKKFGIFPGKRF